MNLVVHVPYDATEDSGGALSLARCAPTFTVEWVGARRMAVAVFPSLPTGIDLAVQLVGEAVRLPDARASVNSVPLSGLAKLWQRLMCYRDSLQAPDPIRYCRERAGHFQTLVGCEGRQCPVSCQFICQPCLHMPEKKPPHDVNASYHAAAQAAEIAWCPQLALPPTGPDHAVTVTGADQL